jgi:hypothetical protein
MYFCAGEMAERSNAAVLKTVDCNRSGGSNPSLSAKSIWIGKCFLFLLSPERCRSGRTGRSRKPLSAYADPGFESLPLRSKNNNAPVIPEHTIKINFRNTINYRGSELFYFKKQAQLPGNR